jgi:hypothetical protein
MRHTISAVVAVIALVAGAMPALACGDGPFTGPCSPCGQAYGSACSQPYYGDSYRRSAYERLPEPSPQYGRSPQYFYADQGPTFSGPGMFAPVPTYQESAVSGWGAYNHRTYYGYDGGRYANATNHDYDGMPSVEGPAIYRYRAHPRFRPWWARTGYEGVAPPMRRNGYIKHYSQLPRASYAPHHSARLAGPRSYGHREQEPRRYN